MAKILLIDDHDIVRRAVTALMTREGHAVVEAVDGRTGLEALRGMKPDLIILDQGLPDASGTEILPRIRELAPQARIIVFTGFPDEQAKRRFHELGVSQCLSKGMNIDALIKAVRRELSLITSSGDAAPTSRPRVLVVDDNEQIRGLLGRFFEGKGYQVASAVDGTGALEAAARFSPQLVLLDIDLPGMSGIDVLQKLRQSPDPAAVIMITGNSDLETARRCMSLGASDFIMKPLNLEYLETVVWAKLFLES